MRKAKEKKGKRKRKKEGKRKRKEKEIKKEGQEKENKKEGKENEKEEKSIGHGPNFGSRPSLGPNIISKYMEELK